MLIHMTKRRTAAVVTAIVVAAIGVSVPVARGGGKPDPTFKVLQRPEKAQDHLPANSHGGPLGAIDPDSARLVGNIDGHDVYMAPGPEDTVCLLDEDQQGYLGGGCMARDSIQNGEAFTGWRDGPSGEFTVVIPVADAYDTAEVDGRTLPVQNNVALGHAPAGKGKMELKGPDATLESDISLGATTPSASGG